VQFITQFTYSMHKKYKKVLTTKHSTTQTDLSVSVILHQCYNPVYQINGNFAEASYSLRQILI